MSRDHSGSGPSQCETTLQCNVVSHWMNLHTEWSLRKAPQAARWRGVTTAEIILDMGSANERKHYLAMSSLSGWTHTRIKWRLLSLAEPLPRMITELCTENITPSIKCYLRVQMIQSIRTCIEVWTYGPHFENHTAHCNAVFCMILPNFDWNSIQLFFFPVSHWR